MPYFLAPLIDGPRAKEAFGPNRSIFAGTDLEDGANLVRLGRDRALVWTPSVTPTDRRVTLLADSADDTISAARRLVLRDAVAKDRTLTASARLNDIVRDLLVTPEQDNDGKRSWNPLLHTHEGYHEIFLGPGGPGKNLLYRALVAPEGPHSKDIQDTFNRANGNLNGSTTSDAQTTWSLVQGTSGNAQINSNQYQFSSSLAEFGVAILGLDMDTVNQYSQVELVSYSIVAFNISAEVAVRLRFGTNGGGDEGYAFFVSNSGRGIYDWMGSTLTSDATVTTSGTLKLSVNGSSLIASVNGSTILSTTDTAYATYKKVGVCAYTDPANVITYDNYRGADISAGATALTVAPASGVATTTAAVKAKRRAFVGFGAGQATTSAAVNAKRKVAAIAAAGVATVAVTLTKVTGKLLTVASAAGAGVATVSLAAKRKVTTATAAGVGTASVVLSKIGGRLLTVSQAAGVGAASVSVKAKRAATIATAAGVATVAVTVHAKRAVAVSAAGRGTTTVTVSKASPIPPPTGAVADVLWLAEIGAIDPNTGSAMTLRVATGQGFRTRPSETPASTEYKARLKQPVNVTRSIFAPGATGGKSKVVLGDLILNNDDGALDAWADYAYDGQPLVIRRGTIYSAYPSEFVTDFVGTMLSVETSLQEITLSVADRQIELNTPIQTTVYAGSNSLPNGLEGVPEDLKGKPKPFIFGIVTNISPPCVNTSKLIYQVHDGAITSMQGVYDRGATLTSGGTYATQADLLDDSLAPTAGQYKTYLAGGYFRLGSTPDGQITADVTRNISVTAARENAPGEMYKAMLIQAGVSSGDIVAADITAMNVITASPCGRYVDEVTPASVLLDEIAETVGAWWGLNNQGEFRFVQLANPSGTPVHYFTEFDIELGSFSRLPTKDQNNGLPGYKSVLRYNKNYTVQSSDVAASVTDARRGVITQEWREQDAYRTDVLSVHALAVVIRADTLHQQRAYAATEGIRRLALRAVTRQRYDITVQYTNATAAIDLGDVVSLRHPRFNLFTEGSDTGRLCTVIGIQPDARARRIRFTLWCSAFGQSNLMTEDDEYLLTEAGDYLITE